MDTERLFGVDHVPMRPLPQMLPGQELIQEIGRKSIFGNPLRPAAGEERQGKTLDAYRKWLFAALKQEPWALTQYVDATGIELPRDFAKRVALLGDMQFWCPGCKEQSEAEGVCHGSILRKAVKWLNTLEGAKACAVTNS